MDMPSLLVSARRELGLPQPAPAPVVVAAPAARNLVEPSHARPLIGMGGRAPLPSEVRAATDTSPPLLDSVHSTLLALGSRYRPASQALADVATGRSTVLAPSRLAALAGQRSAAAATISNLFVDGIGHGAGSMSRAPRTEGNKVDLLVRNKEYLPRLRDDLEHARESITINQFNWEPDGSGTWVADILRAKAKAGLDVRVTVDGYGIKERGDDVADALQRDLTAAGVKFVRTGGFALGGSGFEHRKLITVDDRIAYTGGLGFGQKYDTWTDLMLRMEGPAGAVAGADALATHGELTGGPGDASLGARIARLRTTLTSAAATGRAPLADRPPASGPLADAHAAVTILDNRPGEDLAATESFLRDAATATDRLWATSTYITSTAARDALIDASRRGVDVKLLVTGLTAGNDTKTIQMGRSMYGDLLDAGVEVFEYPTILHAKSWVKDDDVASVGSMNLSKSSMARAREMTARVEDPTFAERYAAFHAQTRSEAHQVTRDEVGGLGLRAIGAVTRTLGLQF